MEAAATFLAVRSRSVQETRRRLTQLGYRAELVEDVIKRLLAMHYLDDETFARAWVESRDRARPRGEMALRRELSLKGIERDTIANVLDDRAEMAHETTSRDEGSASHVGAADAAVAGTAVAGKADDGPAVSPEIAAAVRLVERRRAALLRVADPRQRRQKTYALLARNGFRPDVCREVSATFGSTDEPDRE